MENKNTNLIIGGFIMLFALIIIFGFAFLELQSSDDTDSSEEVIESTLETIPTQPGVEGEMPQMQGQRGGGAPMISEEEQEAIDNNDYDTWLEVVDERNPIVQYITSDELFSLYVDMQQAIEDQDLETAESLREEIGLPEQQERPEAGQPPIMNE